MDAVLVSDIVLSPSELLSAQMNLSIKVEGQAELNESLPITEETILFLDGDFAIIGLDETLAMVLIPTDNYVFEPTEGYSYTFEHKGIYLINGKIEAEPAIEYVVSSFTLASGTPFDTIVPHKIDNKYLQFTEKQTEKIKSASLNNGLGYYTEQMQTSIHWNGIIGDKYVAPFSMEGEKWVRVSDSVIGYADLLGAIANITVANSEEFYSEPGTIGEDDIILHDPVSGFLFTQYGAVIPCDNFTFNFEGITLNIPYKGLYFIHAEGIDGTSAVMYLSDLILTSSSISWNGPVDPEQYNVDLPNGAKLYLVSDEVPTQEELIGKRINFCNDLETESFEITEEDFADMGDYIAIGELAIIINNDNTYIEDIFDGESIFFAHAGLYFTYYNEVPFSSADDFEVRETGIYDIHCAENGLQCITFIPSQTGWYGFTALGDVDTQAWLCLENLKILNYGDQEV